MRTLKHLLELIRKEYLLRPKYYAGLCEVLSNLRNRQIINLIEERVLRQYLENNRPKAFFGYSITNFFFLTSLQENKFFWKPYKIRPRKRWLNKHINKIQS